ncbi:hypothetical protein [Klenkia marina]|nr:hypothetical protein [Klenkia marina]
MGRRDGAARSLWRELLPTAFLLTGDQVAAQHLVVRALSRGRPPTDHDTGVVALVRVHRRRWSSACAGRITGELPAPWWAAPADLADARDLATRLDALDRDERTAVVLRGHEQWDPERTTALLPHVDLDPLLQRLPADLPRRLDVLAGLCGTAALHDDAVVGAVRATSARRARRTVLGAVGVAAVVAAGVWMPSPAEQPTAEPTTGRPVAARPDPGGALAAAPRGPLAGDPDLLAAVRARLVADGGPGEGLRLLYGDDVLGVRVLLVAGPDGVQYWLTGPDGASPADLDVTGFGSGVLDETAMAVTVPGADGAVRLVVVAEEGTDLGARTGVDVDPSTGLVSQGWVDLPTTDGVAAAVLDRTWQRGLRVLADGPDDAPVELWPVPTGEPSWSLADAGPGAASRSGNLTASTYAYERALATIADATGWAPDRLQVSVLGATDVPTPSGGSDEVVAVAAVLPDGAVVTTTGSGYVRKTAGGFTSSWNDCGGSAYPAGTDPARVVVAATCLVPGSDGGGFDRTTVVFAPPGVDVELRTVDGAPVEVELDAGAGWSTYVGAQDLATATADGATYPVAGPAADALAY